MARNEGRVDLPHPMPWMSGDELGSVGRFANSDYGDPSFLGALEEALPQTTELMESRMR
jgi:hypothetical protein